MVTSYKNATQYQVAYDSPNGATGWSEDLQTDLAAFWKFNGDATDAHASFDLTAVNSPTYATGHVYNSAASLASASSQYYTHADDVGLSLGDVDFAVNCWIRAASSRTHCIISKGNLGSYNTTEFSLEFRATDIAALYVGTGTSFKQLLTTDTITVDSWHMLTAWHDASGNTVNIQLDDGTPVSDSWTDGSHDTANALEIGRWASFNGGHWNGRIGYVAYRIGSFWSAADRTALWNSGDGLAL